MSKDFEDKPGQGKAGTRISAFSIKYPVTVTMMLISFLVLGAVSVTKIPLVLFPDLSAPFLLVMVPYPNATPEQVQESIAKPLEEVLATIPNVKRITSNCNADSAQIVLEFDWGQDVEWLRADVREKIDQSRDQLPSDVRDIYVQNFSTTDIPIIEGRISSGRDLRGSYDFLDLKIKRPLERVPGVADVSIDGVARQEIDIDLRLDDIKAYRVDIDALFRKLDGTNMSVSVGRIEDRGYRFGVLTDGSVRSLEQLRNFPVNDRGLLLKNVANIELREPEPAYGRHLNGVFAIALVIRKASDANTVETVDRIMETVEELNRDPSLEGIEVLVWHNAGKEITNSLSGLLNAGTVGALLAVAVLFIFLRRLGATLAIGLSIPFSIIAGIGFLYLMGNTLNVLSMMGLMLSTGMLVDNAVVVLESIYSHREKGVPRREASQRGTQDVIKAVVASTLTSIIIFVPLVFGKKTNFTIFLGHTGMAIMVTLLCSLFISVTLIPLGMARLFNVRLRSERPAAKGKPQPAEGRLLNRYMRLLQWSLKRPVWTVVGIAAILASAFIPASNLKDNSVDAQDLEEVQIEYEFSESYHYAKIEEDFIEPVEAYLLPRMEEFGLENVYSWYGNSEAATRLFFDKTKVDTENVMEIRKKIAEGLPVIPGAEIRLGQQEGAENRTFLSVALYGENPSTLRDLMLKAKRELVKDKEFPEIFTGVEDAREEVQIVLNRVKAQRLGISPQSVAGILGIVVRGQQLRGYRTSDGEIEVWVRLRPGDREDLDDLNSMVVGGGPCGEEIRLGQVADLRVIKTPGSIRRENRRTFATMWINFTGDKVDDGKAKIETIFKGLDYPSGYSWSFGARTIEQEAEDQEFAFNLLLAFFMVYFVMATLFESFAHPFAIMFSLFFAFPGVVWFLFLTGTPFNLMGMIGVLILMGIVVNNGIVLIDHVNNLRRAGLSRAEAIVEGCRERFRPILMTAATTVVGLIPLAVGTSGIFGLRYFPMARTLMGGLIASTVLTLLVLPTVYRLIDDLSVWLRSLWWLSSPKRRRVSESVGSESPA